MREIADLIVSQSEELGSLVLNPESFSNSGYYRSSYRIPDEERLLVYVCNDKPKEALSGLGTMITDEAIYVHPTVRSDREGDRIPLTDICSFLVYKDKDGQVKLFNSEKKFKIFSTHSKVRQSAANALVTLLQALQSSMMLDLNNKQTFNRTLKKVYSAVRAQFGVSGVLPGDYIELLQVMEDFPEFRREVVFIQMENEYRRCSHSSYERLLEEKKSLLNEENIKVLKNPHELFFTAFIRDLSNRDAYSDVKAIIDAYLRLKAQPRLSYYEANILLYLCVRMEDYDYLEQMLREVGDDLEQKELWDFFAFYSEYKNHKMHLLMARAAAFGELTQEDLLHTNDLGFSAIHYAILLGNHDIIRHILPKADWAKYRSPLEKDKIANCLYDPMFLASIVIKDEELLSEIFRYTSPAASALARSIHGMDSMIDINTRLLSKYPEHQEEYRIRIEEYKSMQKEMKAELRSLTREQIDRQRELLSIIKEAGHPLADYMIKMYTTPRALVTWLTDTVGERCIARYKHIFFATSVDADIKLSYCKYVDGNVIDTNVSENDSVYLGIKTDHPAWDQRNARIYDNPIAKQALEEERKRQEERARRRREFMEHVSMPTPHAGSWFSESAHSNLSALKEEYRILVKKYHPDSSGDDKTARILMKIMTERADILDRIRKGATA